MYGTFHHRSMLLSHVVSSTQASSLKVVGASGCLILGIMPLWRASWKISRLQTSNLLATYEIHCHFSQSVGRYAKAHSSASFLSLFLSHKPWLQHTFLAIDCALSGLMACERAGKQTIMMSNMGWMYRTGFGVHCCRILVAMLNIGPLLLVCNWSWNCQSYMLPSEMFHHQDAVELGLAGVYFVSVDNINLHPWDN